MHVPYITHSVNQTAAAISPFSIKQLHVKDRYHLNVVNSLWHLSCWLLTLSLFSISDYNIQTECSQGLLSAEVNHATWQIQCLNNYFQFLVVRLSKCLPEVCQSLLQTWREISSTFLSVKDQLRNLPCAASFSPRSGLQLFTPRLVSPDLTCSWLD